MAGKPHIAIVGGGIGGTCAAILLQQRGYGCTVYEQAPAYARVGAGINLAPNSTRIFRAMGLEDQMLAAGIRPRVKYSREWDSGKILFTIPVPELEARYAAPFLAFHRGDLQRVLTSAVAPDTFRFGKRLAGLAPRGNGAVLSFEDGSSATADIVIGADGVHSRVREHLQGPQAPLFHGLVAYRSIFPTSLLGGMPVADNTKWWAPDRYVLVYFLSEARDEVYVVTGVPEP